jgi:epoxyqueuosine reductase
MVDTGVLSDRAVAVRAGIGSSGKNCAVITPEFGSWVFLGELITNLPLPPDQALATDLCGNCTRCIDACPTGALQDRGQAGGGVLNAQRCLSFITQMKGEVPAYYQHKLGNRLYGCDTCQLVCPYNKEASTLRSVLQEDVLPDPELAVPLLLPILSLSNRAFKETFGQTSAGWRGRGVIQRNAIIALGNYREQRAVPHLRELVRKDPRAFIRSTCAEALEKIEGHRDGDEGETDEHVRS